LIGGIFIPNLGKEHMQHLIEYRGEVLLGKAPNVPESDIRRGERLRLDFWLT